MLPTARAAARDTGKGVGPVEIGCYTSFPYLGSHQAPKHDWYKTFLFPPLLPFYFLPYPFPTACIHLCKLTFCDKCAYTL